MKPTLLLVALIFSVGCVGSSEPDDDGGASQGGGPVAEEHGCILDQSRIDSCTLFSGAGE
jgi:hypothetical protein